MSQTETQIKITLPDGSQKELPPGTTGADLAQSISAGLLKSAVGILSNGEIVDLNRPLEHGATIKILTEKDPEGLEILRHSTAHIMAQAVQQLFPKAKIAIGPTIENGFYYDFDIEDHQLTPQDLEKIEAKMKEIAAKKQKFVRTNIEDVDKLLAEFNTSGEVYKAELLAEKRNDNPTLYLCVNPENNKTEWNDFCRGPHLPDTSFIKAFKLLSVAGAYWRGSEKNKMLQRVYATCFFKQKDLEEHLHRIEEAEKRDHRKLGKQLDLFSIQDEVGPGLVLWHPNAALLREELENYWRKLHRKKGYQLVYCPHIAKKDLWEISGHAEFYWQNMFPLEIEDEDYVLKPMNCPFHVLIFKSQPRSYRELPIRLGELGTVYRYEKSGTMHGLTRVRGFTQDDAHLFCRPDQIASEIKGVLDIVAETFGMFNMSYDVELSTRPDEYVGELEGWNQAEAALQKALDDYGHKYEINPGDGAFYGPKIDFKVKDALNRVWQCATVQVDFNLPQRFGIKYKDSDGQDKQPIMIHRAIFGSMERFVATLIEHYGGAFPAWLAPTQVAILTIADRHEEKAQEYKAKLEELNIRVYLDNRNEGVGHKIRDGIMQKYPYLLVVGDKELEQNAVSVRKYPDGDLGSQPFDKFLTNLALEIQSHGKQAV